MRLDESTPPPDLLDHPTAFAAGAPAAHPGGIAAAAEGAGLRLAGIKALHPHPLPASVKRRGAALLQPARARVPAPARGLAARPRDGVVVRRRAREDLTC